jgi:hypothetical protein
MVTNCIFVEAASTDKGIGEEHSKELLEYMQILSICLLKTLERKGITDQACKFDGGAISSVPWLLR